jgi:hypothetical protein
MTDIYPTHCCFDDVTDYLNRLAAAGATRDVLVTYTVVHGIVVLPDGTPFAHGWLEHEGEVIEGGIYEGERVWIRMTRADFEGLHAVFDETRYTLDEVLRLDREHGPGPWKPEYIALCSSDRKVWRPAKPNVEEGARACEK